MRAQLVTSLFVLALLPVAATAADVSVASTMNGISQPMGLDLPFTEVGMIARTDLGGDGVDEFIVSSGPFEAPQVSLLGSDGSHIATFYPYDETMTSGVTLAVGDVTGDGLANIITGTMVGGGPHVRVFDTYGKLQHQFFAYAETFTGGVNVATADIDGDGTDEIVTAAGLTGGPHVRALSQHGQLVAEFFAFDVMDRSGVSVTRVDGDHDGRDELVVTRFGHGASEARIVSFDHRNVAQLGDPFPLYSNYTYGATLFPVNDDLFGAAPNGHGGPHVRMLRADGQPTFDHFAFSADQTDRVLFAATDTDNFLAVLAPPTLNKRLDKHIFVDLGEQRLYAYQHGVLRNTFLISAGKWPWRTPTGEFEVMRKLRYHDYRWFDNAGNELYNLPNVEYNLEFTRHYYIHNAYWHSNWGNPMSHGCVNAPLDGVKWTYEWAEVGTPVIVQD